MAVACHVCCISALVCLASCCVIRPGTLPLDTDGNPVHAHGGGAFVEDGVIYLIGTSQKEAVPSDSKDPKSQVYYLSEALNLYSTIEASDGLCNWHFHGKMFSRSALEQNMRPVLPTGVPASMERAKLAKAANGQYVIWMHLEAANNVSYSNVAVLRSSKVTGPYTWSSNFLANGMISKDSTIYTDVDGDNYFVRDNAHLCDSISPLTDDGLGVKAMCSHTGPESAPGYYDHGCQGNYSGPGNGTASHPPWLCEGVAMFRDPIDNRLFMMGSHLSSWKANAAMLFISSQRSVCSSNSTSWTYLGNPAVGKGSKNTFGAQSTFVLPWNKSVMIAMMDDWTFPNETTASMVWLPLTRSNAGVWTMRWYDEWMLQPEAQAISV